MAYKMMKVIISRGGYDKEALMDKLDTYFALGRLTDAEYKELASLILDQRETEADEETENA